MKTVYCIALTGEGATGSEWYHKREDRNAAKGLTGAQSEAYFTMDVEDNLSREDITRVVDDAEWQGNYITEKV